MIKVNFLTLLFTALLLLSMSKIGWAGEINRFNLSITHSESERVFQNETLQTKTSSISGSGTEKLSDRLDGSLIIGYQEQVQDNNSIIAAQYAVGYFIGVGFTYDAFKTEKYRFATFAKYQYHQLEGRDGEQKTNITWYDITFGIENYYNLTTNTQLFADVSYYQESGTQRALEPLSQTISFENKSDITYGVGLAYYLKASSHIAVKWLQGAHKGFQLYFANDF